MNFLLCRNRVADFEQWRAVFTSHAQAHREAGLELVNFWRGADEPDNVFFVFRVTEMAKARAFIGNAPAAEAAKVSGVLDAEYHFVEGADAY